MNSTQVKFIFFILILAQASRAEVVGIADIAPEPSIMANISTGSNSSTAPVFENDPTEEPTLAQPTQDMPDVNTAGAPMEVDSSEMDQVSLPAGPLVGQSPEAADNGKATLAPQSAGYNGIQAWLQNTAFPALQNVQSYATETLIPAAQEMTQTVSEQAKSTGKDVVGYMQNTLVPSIKDVVGRVGETLVSWSKAQESSDNIASDPLNDAQSSASNEPPVT